MSDSNQPKGVKLSVNRPIGVPESISHNGRKYTFDCIAGTGDAIYRYTKDSGERFHVIRVVNEA